MSLNGSQIAQLLDALLDAYPRREDLRRMVRIELNEGLDVVAGGGTLRDVTFTLIEWALSVGRIDELIGGARRDKPGNARLQAFTQSLGVADGKGDPPAAVQPEAPLPVKALILQEKEASLKLLAAMYMAASQQLRTELNAANRPALQERLRQLEEEMVALQAEIDRLKRSV